MEIEGGAQESWFVAGADPGGQDQLSGRPGTEMETDQRLGSWSEAGELPLFGV